MGGLSGDAIRWAMIAVSMFDMLLLLWLGAVVLLNVERRSFGVYFAGGSLLLASLFFALNTAVVAEFLPVVNSRAIFWWNAGWLLAAVMPCTWYGVVLWHAGYWRHLPTRPARVHLVGTTLATLLLVTLIAVGVRGPVWFDPLGPAVPKVARTIVSGASSPLLLAVYFPYMLVCTLLSIHALLHPGPTDRMMGESARERARPWMLAASATMLAVGLMVGGAMLWLRAHFGGDLPTMPGNTYIGAIESVLVRLDLIIVIMLALAATFVGQAVVSYQVFTGRSLPHRGLMRQWRSALVVAGGFSAVAGIWAVEPLPAIHGLLLAGAIMIIALALFSRQSFVEHERHIATLRPFASGERFMARLLADSDSADGFDARGAFDALCASVLGASSGSLVPVGAVVSLAGDPLVYPHSLRPRQPMRVPETLFDDPAELCRAVDAASTEGAVIAIPLYNEQGPSGALMLGAKRDRGLYTYEEIEIARATCERIIDTRATLEMSRRLLTLQRNRMQLSQVVDRRTRRTLHDEIAPAIHAVMLGLSSGEPPADAIAQLGEVHNHISRLLREMPPSAVPDPRSGGLVAGIRAVVELELKDAFDAVEWAIDPGADLAASRLGDVTAEVVYYAVREALRNAARHGRGGDARRRLTLSVAVARAHDGRLRVSVEDDGVGPGGSDSTHGSRQGLTLHTTMLAVIGGSLTVEEASTGGTRVTVETAREHQPNGIEPA